MPGTRKSAVRKLGPYLIGIKLSLFGHYTYISIKKNTWICIAVKCIIKFKTYHCINVHVIT